MGEDIRTVVLTVNPGRRGWDNKQAKQSLVHILKIPGAGKALPHQPELCPSLLPPFYSPWFLIFDLKAVAKITVMVAHPLR